MAAAEPSRKPSFLWAGQWDYRSLRKAWKPKHSATFSPVSAVRPFRVIFAAVHCRWRTSCSWCSALPEAATQHINKFCTSQPQTLLIVDGESRIESCGIRNDTPIPGYRTNTTNAGRYCTLGDRKLTLLAHSIIRAHGMDVPGRNAVSL